MGYITDQNGIVSRFAREGDGWNGHLENSKNFIREHCIKEECKSIAILGSGWLLDVPIDDLSNQFEKIYLIDIVHPQQIKHKYRNYSNIHFIEDDITGGLIENVYKHCNKSPKSQLPYLENIAVPQYSLHHKVDIVVSLNIMNQLDILLVDYLKEFYDFPEDELNAFRQRIQNEHYHFLQKHNYCLITDYEEHVFDENNKETITQLVYIDFEPHEIEKKWQWEFDKSQTYYPGKKVIFNVIGLLGK